MRLPGEVARCKAQSVVASSGVAYDRVESRRARAAWNQGSPFSAIEVWDWVTSAVVVDVVVREVFCTGAFP